MNQKFTSSIKVFLLALILLLPLNQAKAVNYENPKAVEALSKCLAAQDATMYGTANCGHCKKQKEMFGSYFRNVRFVDCRAGSAAAKECNVAKVGKFPQWNFTNGKKIVREVGLDEIASVSDCDMFVAKALGDDYSESVISNNSQSNNNLKRASEDNNTNNDFSNPVYGNSAELAKCLKSKGVKFYGSPKCSHCNKQKEMFEGNFEKYLSSNFHNCKGSGSEVAECNKNNTFPFPTWREPSTGKKLLGPEKSLNQIAKTFGCTLEEREMISDNNTNSSDQSSSQMTNMNDETEQNKVFSKPVNYQNDQQVTSSSNSSNSYNQQDKVFLEKKQEKLAQCLINRNIILYGILDQSKGKPIQQKATMQQLGELGSASKKVKIVDCSLGQAECNGILVYPTWILEDKRELAGVYELDNLAQILNCELQ